MNASYPAAAALLTVILEDFADGSTGEAHTITVRPTKMEIVRNDHRSADTCHLELTYRDLPADPRAFRDALIAVYLGDMGGPNGGYSRVARSSGTTAQDEPPAFLGFVDVIDVALSESAEIVRIDARDYTGKLLDTKWSGKAIDVTRPLIDVVREVVETVYPDGVNLAFSPGAETVSVAEIIGRRLFAPQSSDDTWTVLCDLCGRAGLVPVFVLDELRIVDPTDIGTNTRARFVYGDRAGNVASLGFKRGLDDRKVVQIEVRAFNEKTRETLVATFPTAPIVVKRKVSPKTKKATTEAAPVRPFYVSGSYTPASLAHLAESIYRRAEQRQIEARLTTADMVDLDGVSLVHLSNGDTASIRLGTALQSTIAAMAETEAVAYLTATPRSLDVPTATALVRAVKSAEGLARDFYIVTATHAWDVTGGYNLTLTLGAYVGPTETT